MMQSWGHTHVSSAHEVYLVLSRPPHDARGHWLWRSLLSIEPPIWGCAAARGAALAFASRVGGRVWSWDDEGIVFSDFESQPPRSLHYRSWHRLALPAAHPETTPSFSEHAAST
jgi:hypothetical protein